MSTFLLSCGLCVRRGCIIGVRQWTYNLVDHDQDARLRMLTALHVSKDCNTKALIKTVVKCSTKARGLGARHLWLEEKDIGACPGCHIINVFEYVWSDAVGCAVSDQVLIDVDEGASLRRKSGLSRSQKSMIDIPKRLGSS